jgi:hypothetical protein
VLWFEAPWHYCRLRLNTEDGPQVFETEHASMAVARRAYARMQRDLIDARPYGYGGHNLTDTERLVLNRAKRAQRGTWRTGAKSWRG